MITTINVYLSDRICLGRQVTDTIPPSDCAASWRLYFGRGDRQRPGAVETLDDLIVVHDSAAEPLREMMAQHRAHNEKKSNKSSWFSK